MIKHSELFVIFAQMFAGNHLLTLILRTALETVLAMTTSIALMSLFICSLRLRQGLFFCV